MILENFVLSFVVLFFRTQLQAVTINKKLSAIISNLLYKNIKYKEKRCTSALSCDDATCVTNYSVGQNIRRVVGDPVWGKREVVSGDRGSRECQEQAC